MTIDLESSAARMAELVRAVPDSALEQATPCDDYRVGDLLEHINGCAIGFTEAALKTVADDGDGVQVGDASRLAADWRESIPAALDGLVTAWRTPGAFDGMTKAGGFDLPAEVAAVVAVEELTVHAWDLARATGLDFTPTDDDVAIALSFLEEFSGPESADQRGAAYAPAVFLEPAASGLERAVALSGRDVTWSPTAG